MPINELERHPYLDYLSESIYEQIDYTGLIVGSYPIYACTDTIDENLNIVNERYDEDKVRMRFFYGSKKSEFWYYCSNAFGQSFSNNINRRNSIDFLNRNKILITDVIRQTNRREEKSGDIDLLIATNVNDWIQENFMLNHQLPRLLNKHKKVENLFFTSQKTTGNSPFGLFQEIFGEDLRIIEDKYFGKICAINNTHYNCFLLPTPKPRALHFTDTNRSVLFVNYMRSVDNDFLIEISRINKVNRSSPQTEKLTKLRKDCLIECYKQAFVFNNLDFDGTL